MPSTAAEKQDGVKALNALLRGEIAARESYEIARARIETLVTADLDTLRTIEQAHAQLVQELRSEIERLGGTPDARSGPGSTFTAATVSGPARVFADAAILRSLKEGEERALQAHRVVLGSANDRVRRFVTDVLMPAQRQHVSDLEGILARL